jgi:hypothetical protein
MHPEVQSQLLRLVEYGELKPLGYGGTIRLRDSHGHLHIQFIAATNSPWVASLVAPCNGATLSDESTEFSNQLASYNGLTVRPDLVYRMPHVLKLHSLLPEEIAIAEGESWRPGALILLESQLHELQHEVIWTPEALQYFHGCSKDLKGNRRQARMIAARAISKVLNRDRMGTDPFTRNYEITEEIIKAAIGPIMVTPEIQVPPPSEASDGKMETERKVFLEKVSHFIRHYCLWTACTELSWKKLQSSELSDPEKVAVILCSVKFQGEDLGASRLAELWSAGRPNAKQSSKGSTIQNYINTLQHTWTASETILQAACQIISERCKCSIQAENDMKFEAARKAAYKALIAVP